MEEKHKRLIADLEDFKTRSKARKLMMASDRELICPLICRYILDSESNVNGVWAGVAILAEFKYAAAVPLMKDLIRSRPSLAWDLKDAIFTISGEEVSLTDTQAESSSREFLASLIEKLDPEEILSFVDQGSHFSLILKTNQVRKHELLLMCESDHIEVYTECGAFAKNRASELAELNESLELGYVDLREKVSGSWVLTLHYKILLTSSAQEKALRRLVQVADALEEQLTGKDEI